MAKTTRLQFLVQSAERPVIDVRHSQSKRPAFSKRVLGLVHDNVRGCRFRIGQVVRVCQIVDETAPKRFLQRLGIVEHFEYSCGCGQSYPHDPMIGVRFANGELEEFWSEELDGS